MQCPYCGNSLQIAKIVNEEKDELVDGCIKCECSSFPLLKGILILKESPLNDSIIKLIKERRIEEAIIRCLWPERYEKADSIKNLSLLSSLRISRVFDILAYLTRIEAEGTCKKLYRQYSNSNVPFFNLLGNGLFDKYLKHRFSTESFWSLYSFIPLFQKKNERILDLACGAGHASFVLSNYIESQQIVSADSSFKLLYLAKKYLVPKAQCICLDANSPLPFKNRTFSSIIMSDAIHYVRSRISLAREMKRALFPKGFILLLHVHNSLTSNLGAGYALSPKSWRALFKEAQLEIRAIPEIEAIRCFLSGNELNLMNKYSGYELNSANALIFLATLDKSLLTTYSEIDQEFLKIKNNLVINPIFNMKKKSRKILLERPTSELAFDRYPLSEKYLVRKYEIDKLSVKGRQVKISDTREVEDLMKKFIVINVPNNYV
jgi:SAM-dependent methyltransferase